jgi:hypothetical protein
VERGQRRRRDVDSWEGEANRWDRGVQRLGRGWGGERETNLVLYHMGNPNLILGMGVVLIDLS